MISAIFASVAERCTVPWGSRFIWSCAGTSGAVRLRTAHLGHLEFASALMMNKSGRALMADGMASLIRILASARWLPVPSASGRTEACQTMSRRRGGHRSPPGVC
jgi:hypothetical protein